MTTNELVRRIDETTGMGMGITADLADEGIEAESRIESFCREVRGLIEDIYGSGNQLSGRFEGSSGYDRKLLEQGLAVLKDLRRVAVYSGEFSS